MARIGPIYLAICQCDPLSDSRLVGVGDDADAVREAVDEDPPDDGDVVVVGVTPHNRVSPDAWAATLEALIAVMDADGA